MMDPRLTLSNRPENLKPLMNYVRKWAEDRGLSPNRRCSLEKVVEDIFRHLVTYAYQPDQPGSIAISLEEKGTPVAADVRRRCRPPQSQQSPGAGRACLKRLLPR